jgi:5-methylcytosine-specific restriction endonuclease McrA
MSRWTYDSRQYRKALRHVQATGPTCWLCSHPGSDSLDHRLPASLFPELRADPANWVPAHGVKGCPVCGVKCQQVRGNRMSMPTPSPRSRRW